METRVTRNHLLVEKFENNRQLIGTRRKIEESEGENKEVQKRRAMIRQLRRHNWQPKYEMEFGLLAIERDPVSNNVLLAMCGFCKVFGREGKYEQMVQQDQKSGNDTKKRRRRSLTTTKFFRAFRIDNIRSHLQGAHPRRWTEYEMLPKQDNLRSRYLQGDLKTALNAESDTIYAQAQQPVASGISKALHVAEHASHNGYILTGISGGSQSKLQVTASLTYSAWQNHVAMGAASSAAVSANTRDTYLEYKKRMTERIALDRELLEFDKMRFSKEVELRERELALREKHMDQQVALQEKVCEAACENNESESA